MLHILEILFLENKKNYFKKNKFHLYKRLKKL